MSDAVGGNAMLGPVYSAGQLLASEPEPTQWVVDGWISEGASVLIGAHGGTGKSVLALQLAACLAAGRRFLGLGTHMKRVLFYSAEDPKPRVQWRLHRICNKLGIAPAAIDEYLHLVDQTRLPAELIGRDRHGAFGFAPLFAELESVIRDYGTEVLIVDSASDAFGGNEIVRAEVRRYITEVQRLVPEWGAVVHAVHVDKSFARGNANGQGYSGSTAWHNSVRQRWELSRPAADDGEDGNKRSVELSDPRRVLTLAKNNYGLAGVDLALTYDPESDSFAADAAPGGIVADIRDRSERRGIVLAMIGSTSAGVPVPAAMQGPRTAYLALSQRPEFPDSLKGGRRPLTKRFARHLEHMRQIRYVVESSIRRSNRHQVAVLEVTPEACAEYANT
jgi:KaiC/GvpD/RAD55 family RecA-like ATPase